MAPRLEPLPDQCCRNFLRSAIYAVSQSQSETRGDFKWWLVPRQGEILPRVSAFGPFADRSIELLVHRRPFRTLPLYRYGFSVDSVCGVSPERQERNATK